MVLEVVAQRTCAGFVQHGSELRVVDAFTDEPFAGNPAAVAVLERFPPENRMQAIAREMHLSETAFVVPRDDTEYDLRWFTPLVEVDLCGHATLASAHVVGGAVAFHTRSGRLACSESDDGWIDMALPPTRPWRPTRRRWRRALNGAGTAAAVPMW